MTWPPELTNRDRQRMTGKMPVHGKQPETFLLHLNHQQFVERFLVIQRDGSARMHCRNLLCRWQSPILQVQKARLSETCFLGRRFRWQCPSASLLRRPGARVSGNRKPDIRDNPVRNRFGVLFPELPAAEPAALPHGHCCLNCRTDRWRPPRLRTGLHAGHPKAANALNAGSRPAAGGWSG